MGERLPRFLSQQPSRPAGSRSTCAYPVVPPGGIDKRVLRSRVRSGAHGVTRGAAPCFPCVSKGWGFFGIGHCGAFTQDRAGETSPGANPTCMNADLFNRLGVGPYARGVPRFTPAHSCSSSQASCGAGPARAARWAEELDGFLKQLRVLFRVTRWKRNRSSFPTPTAAGNSAPWGGATLFTRGPSAGDRRPQRESHWDVPAGLHSGAGAARAGRVLCDDAVKLSSRTTASAITPT